MVQFIIFSIIGAAGTFAHYSVLYILVEYAGIDPVGASGWGALVGLVINYGLNHTLMFRSWQSHLQTFPKFSVIALLGLSLNVALMALLVKNLQLYYWYAQVLATMSVLMWNFFANTFWTFQVDNTRCNEPITFKAVSVSVHRNSYDKPFLTRLIKQVISIGPGLIAIIALIRVGTLGLYPLVDPTEARYSEMARKMLETGNWVTPQFDYGVPFWGKPPLAVWLTALSLWTGGVNDFSARLPSVVLAAGIGWIVFFLARSQRGEWSAHSSLVILFSTVLFFIMAGSVAMDQSMTLGTTLALGAFWLALRTERWIWGYLFFIGLAIGLLSKGPIAMVLCGLTIASWTSIRGEWAAVWKRLPWIKGAFVMLVISAPWYLLAEHRTPGFLEYFLIGEHWKRFTESGWQGDLYGSGRAHPRGTIWLYWLGASFPWSLVFLGVVISSLVRKRGKELMQSGDGWRLYCLLWMISPLLFFTLSANVIWTYVMPGLPGFALLLSEWVQNPTLVQERKKIRFGAVIGLTVPVLFVLLLMASRFSGLELLNTQKPLVDAYYRLRANPGERLIYVQEEPFSAQFYLQGKARELPAYGELESRLANSDHDFFVLKKKTLDRLPQEVKRRLETIRSYGKFVLLQAVKQAS